MRHYFGTDGVRGLANRHPMTVEFALRLGKAIALHFGREGKRPKLLIGKDPRLSGYMFESALAAGINAMGGDVLYTGPLPTPGIAYLTTTMRCSAGVVISASHNPYSDNGIKIFGADGFKLPDSVELELEALLDDPDILERECRPERIGRSRRLDDASGRYTVFLKMLFPRELSLDGLRIVVDCAHGAAYKVAPAVLWELGAEIIATGNEPNGLNINDGVGALHPEHCAALVREHEADLGISLDGDADRVIFADRFGNIVDGDQVMAATALELDAQGRLTGHTLVATVMSNLGLELAMREHGIQVLRTQVGDRYVVEAMRANGYSFGGEQSGHLVFLDLATTGDGIVAALQMLAAMQRSGKPLHELVAVMQKLPQVLVNFPVREKLPIEEMPEVMAQVVRAEAALGEQGRVLVRYSGTEMKCRVMLEGPEQAAIEALASDIGRAIRQRIGVD
ncbi:MAG: phosphoglucosamine mutase [Myxococcota bacterium]|jgi:phosphoglucosamine mutase|nr:phosphoglucosamine mutase [Myxococcota bacterium]